MRLMTEDLMSKSFNWLFNQGDELNGFDNSVQFYEHWLSLGEVDGDGSLSFFTRVDGDLPFSPANCRIVNVREMSLSIVGNSLFSGWFGIGL